MEPDSTATMPAGRVHEFETGRRVRGCRRYLHEGAPIRTAGRVRRPCQRQARDLCEAAADPLAWWASRPSALEWAQPWTEVLEWEAPFAKWFVGGKLNVPRQLRGPPRGGRQRRPGRLSTGRGSPRRTRTITYSELLAVVCKAANALTELGLRSRRPGRIYMPMIPEAVVAMLACARLGAPTAWCSAASRPPRSRPDRRRGGPAGDHRRRRVRRGSAESLSRGRRGVADGPDVRSTSWWSGAPASTSPGRRAGTSGGTTSSTASLARAQPEAFDAEHPLYLHVHQRHHRPSPRASCTPRAGT